MGCFIYLSMLRFARRGFSFVCLFDCAMRLSLVAILSRLNLNNLFDSRALQLSSASFFLSDCILLPSLTTLDTHFSSLVGYCRMRQCEDYVPTECLANSTCDHVGDDNNMYDFVCYTDGKAHAIDS